MCFAGLTAAPRLIAATADEIAQVPGLPESVALNVYAMLHDGEGDSTD